MAYSQFNASPRPGPGQAKKVSHEYSDHRDMSGTNDDQYGTNTQINQPEISSTMELLKQLQRLVPLIEPMKQEVVQLSKRNSVQTIEGDKTLQKQNDDLLKQLREKEKFLQKMKGILLANKQKIEDLETEKKTAKDYIDELSLEVKKSAQEKKDLESQLDETKTRLSKMIGDKITDGNPDIANLSDENRPTKIAEKYCELYDNEWTDAFEAFEKLGHDDKTIISYLLSILKLTKKQCDIFSERNCEDITKAVYSSRLMPASVPQEVKKQIKDIRKVAAPLTANYVLQEVLKYLSYKISDYKISAVIETNAVQAYIKKCTDICWFMVVQDPPLYFGSDVKENDEFDKSIFKEYTRSGSRVEYLVWPEMYLKEGSRLCKGVAQGCGDPTEKKKKILARPESAPAASQTRVSSPRDIKNTYHPMDHQLTPNAYQANAESTYRVLGGHDKNYEHTATASHRTGNLSRSVYVPSATTEYQQEKIAAKVRKDDFYKYPPRGVSLENWYEFVYYTNKYGKEASYTKTQLGYQYEVCLKHYQDLCIVAAIS